LVRVITVIDPTPTEEPLLVELEIPLLLQNGGYVEEFWSCPLSLGRRRFFTVHLITWSLHGKLESELLRKVCKSTSVLLTLRRG
jgi:hypothetical protein